MSSLSDVARKSGDAVRPELTDLWDNDAAKTTGHIELSRGADAILMAPASADFLAKLVHGRADDLLSTLCLARECPLLVAPAMNRQLWAHPATQRNIAQLRADDVAILLPDNGKLACRENGDARMLETLEPAMHDTVYCSRNLEHYCRHDVSKVVHGLLHVLKPDGFAEIRVPDVRWIMRRYVAHELDIEAVLYRSGAGPINVRDALYG